MTSWGALYATLRRALPSDVPYVLDRELVGADETGGRIVARFAGGQAIEADLLVGADGIGSAARGSAGIAGEPEYSGYVAWRGLELESILPESVMDLLDGSFTFFSVPGLQFLSYLVPGPGGETSPGARNVNWVWYVNTSAAGLDAALTGGSGKRYRSFLPPGEARPEVRTALDALAGEHLPPVLADLVASTSVFMQPVIDVPFAGMRAGRTALIGDAAGTVRPHTASGTSKAFGDARLLAAALTGCRAGAPLPGEALGLWERRRGHELRSIARAGTELASGSMLGTGPIFMDAPRAASAQAPIGGQEKT